MGLLDKAYSFITGTPYVKPWNELTADEKLERALQDRRRIEMEVDRQMREEARQASGYYDKPWNKKWNVVPSEPAVVLQPHEKPQFQLNEPVEPYPLPQVDLFKNPASDVFKHPPIQLIEKNKGLLD